jgi:hypothetical protein
MEPSVTDRGAQGGLVFAAYQELFTQGGHENLRTVLAKKKNERKRRSG